VPPGSSCLVSKLVCRPCSRRLTYEVGLAHKKPYIKEERDRERERRNLDELPGDSDHTLLSRGDLGESAIGQINGGGGNTCRAGIGDGGNYALSVLLVGNLDLLSAVAGLLVQGTVHVGLEGSDESGVRVDLSASASNAVLVVVSSKSTREDLSSTRARVISRVRGGGWLGGRRRVLRRRRGGRGAVSCGGGWLGSSGGRWVEGSAAGLGGRGRGGHECGFWLFVIAVLSIIVISYGAGSWGSRGGGRYGLCLHGRGESGRARNTLRTTVLLQGLGFEHRVTALVKEGLAVLGVAVERHVTLMVHIIRLKNVGFPTLWWGCTGDSSPGNRRDSREGDSSNSK